MTEHLLHFVDLKSGQANGNSFNVQRIICIGRNYADHAVEMGHDPALEPPFFFFKPLSALNTTGYFPLPHYSKDVQYELELVLAVGRGGKNLSAAQAADCFVGLGLGLDMTCRDIQKQAKQAGRPWELAKGFDYSAPCSTLAQGGLPELQEVTEFSLRCNEHLVQSGRWQDMLWSPTALLQHISQFIAILPGDLIYTGTPAGVGPVQQGDVLVASAKGLPQQLSVTVRGEQ